jgi:hypothetical protein
LVESPLPQNKYNYSLAAIGHNDTRKLIDRNVWVAFKNKPASLDALDEELTTIIQRARNDSWNVYLLGHEEQMRFFEVYYANTSLLWAVKVLSSEAGVCVR